MEWRHGDRCPCEEICAPKYVPGWQWAHSWTRKCGGAETAGSAALLSFPKLNKFTVGIFTGVIYSPLISQPRNSDPLCGFIKQPLEFQSLPACLLHSTTSLIEPCRQYIRWTITLKRVIIFGKRLFSNTYFWCFDATGRRPPSVCSPGGTTANILKTGHIPVQLPGWIASHTVRHPGGDRGAEHRESPDCTAVLFVHRAGRVERESARAKINRKSSPRPPLTVSGQK